LVTLAAVTSFKMAPPLTTEQKTRIVEWFLQTNSTITVQRRFKNQYECKEAPARNTVTTLVEQFRGTGNVTGKKRVGSKTRVRTPDTIGTIRASVASFPTRKSTRHLVAENEVSPSTAWRILRTDLRMHPYKVYVFQCLTTVCREKRTGFAEEFGGHLQQDPHTLEHIWLSDEAYFHLTGDIKRQNVLFWGTQNPRQIHKSSLLTQKVLVWCEVSAQAWLGLSCLRITSLGRITLWYSTPSSSLNWDGGEVLFMHSGSNRMELDLTPLQRSWNSCAPFPGSHSVQSFPSAIPVRILMATMQFRFKSAWLLSLGLSEGQSVQQCSPNSAWTEGEDQGKLCTGHKRNAQPCCTEPCITSSSGSRVPRGSHRACHPQRYPYVEF